MYAIVNTGGKQIKVSPGDLVRVEKLESPVGETIELGSVALVAKDDGLVTDADGLSNSKVMGTVVRHGKGKKVRVFKKKRRKGYQRTHGHRQHFTELRISDIQA